MRRLMMVMITALAACGTSGPTLEDLARDNLVELRAQAVAQHFQPCVAAIDRALAALDGGTRIHDAAWQGHVAATHAACDGPLGRR